MTKKNNDEAVIWLSEMLYSEPINNSFTREYYEKFKFKNITAASGDYVLVSNADSADPDTEEGCDVAKILCLYENNQKKSDPFRAKVRWYSKPGDVPANHLIGTNPVHFYDHEVVEDHRPFDTDVSIETFFKKCTVTFCITNTSVDEVNSKIPYNYICRYRLTVISKRKFNIEPVLEQERQARLLLGTPTKSMASPKTPTSLVKRMDRISISEQRNWSISKNDGTKLLLKRAILTDKYEKQSPKKNTPGKVVSTETNKQIKGKLEDIISLELAESSDEEKLPTLIIRTTTPQPSVVTPKKIASTKKEQTPRRLSTRRTSMATPRKTLDFNNSEIIVSSATRSGRKIKPNNYYEEELSPVKKTPTRSSKKRLISNSSDDEVMALPQTPKTPTTPKNSRLSRLSAAKTPKTPQSVKRKIISDLTPTLQNRIHSVDNIDKCGLENKSLPGREQQLEEILSFVRNKLLDGLSGCMYISGVPGTGKTATVCSALAILKDEQGLPDFQLVEVNGMRIAEPRQAYVQIYKQLTGKSVAWEQACSLLEKRFTNPGPRRIPTVILVDELDALCTRRQDVLYSIMEWASQRCALLTVLAVANTMDLPERALAARVASRLGLTRLTFPPYTHSQLQTIVATRLANTNLTADAIQLIARKVAAVSGDARRALALCSRAAELGGEGAAGLEAVQRALAHSAATDAARALRSCSPAEILILRAVASEVERTGSDETTLSRALTAASALVSIEGRPYKSAPHVRAPTPSQVLAICSRLASLKLLLLEPKASEPRLLLNVSTDDVHYATRQISV